MRNNTKTDIGLIRRRKSVVAEERGAHLVELAIIFPLFIGLIFVLFDTARLASGYSAVRSAVALGTRRGAALSRPEWTKIASLPFAGMSSQELDIGDIDNSSFSSPEFRGPDPHNNVNWYHCMMNSQSDYCAGDTRVAPNGSSLSFLYRIEVRAIAYANAVMRESTGSAAYPCDADKTDGRPGCFNCFTLRGDPTYSTFFTSGGGADWVVKMIALRCEYDVPITSTSVFMGWFPKSLKVNSEMYLSINEYPDSIYVPLP